MTIGVGSRVGPYEVTALLGEGGMGKVWRAHHTALKRDDALKVLPDAFASDPDRLARFRREAQVLASLNHPNIAHVHGLEQSDPSAGSGQAGVQALIMELVDGPTLADRIAQGPIPVDEALPIAKQIAEALEAAHEQGIIHRDLKPANIKLRPDGTVKVLDFGLAKAVEPVVVGSVDATASPTITSPVMMTGVGMLLGTAAYMSPEQARGRQVDKRSDIWAFGCVLYEMLTSRRAFDGDDVSATLARVLEREPDFSALPPLTPQSIVRLLRRAFAKDRQMRLPDIAVARIELADVLSGRRDEAPAPAGHAPWRERAAWAVATMALVALLMLRPATTPTPVQFAVTPPDNGIFSDDGQSSRVISPQFAISPDGRQLAFVATTADGRPRLWVRSVDVAQARVLAGTEGAAHPFWSPDSRFIGFFAAAKLKKVDIGGGLVEVVCDSPGTRGGTWNRNGDIVFAQFWTGGLYRVSAEGGAPVAVTMLDDARQELWHRWPEFLPDGRHFFYLARSAQPEQDAIYIGTLDSQETTRVLAHDSRVVFAPPNHLVFARQQTLVAQEFDLSSMEVVGDAAAIAEPVARYAPTGEGAFSASASGLAYAARIAIPDSQLTWFDRAGRPLGVIGTAAGHRNPALAPDYARVAVQREDIESEIDDLWLIDAARGSASRLTFGNVQNRNPIWSPDGARVAFAAYAGTTDLYQKPANGGREELLIETGATGAFPTSWSLDGRLLVYAAAGSKTSYDLWTLPLDGDRTPRPLLQSSFIETQGQLSPDGRWIAYTTDETGTREVWVQPVPPSGARWQISTDSGSEPRWRRDGGELYYIAGNGILMAVSIKTTLTTFAPAAPQPLFQTRRPFSSPLHTNYSPAADGQRFLINTVAGDVPPPTPITVFLNWSEGLK